MSKINKTFARIIEFVWLILAVVALGTGIHKTLVLGFAESYPFFIITAIALVMFFLRRQLRLNEKRKNTPPVQ